MNDKLIVDGRKNPPLSTYKELSSEYPDLNFLVRAEEEVEVNENIRLKIFIPDLINYIAAADLFITNPGFASLSEGAICKTPMLIDLPTNHFEEIKNLKIAEEEGYGKRINYLKNDILAGVEGEIAKDCSNLKNGLPYLIEKIKEVEED
jgi:UDP-N-acetylglucosamine:LPS N-acetylglucosamine transferase